MKKYRIVINPASSCLWSDWYHVHVKRSWWPFWSHPSGNTFKTLAEAKTYLENIKYPVVYEE